MNTNNITNDIFIESHGSQQVNEEGSFLDISEYLWTGFDTPNRIESIEQSHPQQLFFEIDVSHQKQALESPSPEQMEIEEKPRKSKCMGKSVYNKNVCFNICQKTIKVVKKGRYEDQLIEICEEFGISHHEFTKNINKIKKDFTGPKALAQYLSRQTAQSRVFSRFMKWFLTEKYLRHALNEGQMKDVKAYIQYKNQVILPLLQ